MAAPLRIRDARVPLCLVDNAFPDVDDGLARVDLDLSDGRIAAIHPAGTVPPPPGAEIIDQDGGQVWPGFVDLHTHLDKGHIWPRAENPDGTFEGAITAACADRDANWSAEDVARRFEFGLRCAYAHGTVAIRTHIDSPPPQHRISWPVFRELRTAWAGRIALQAASLNLPEDMCGPFGKEIADLVAESGGILGLVTFMCPELDQVLDRVFALATERNLDLDFHVDETHDPAATSLRRIAEAALRNRFTRRILCGHCCSLAQQEADSVETTLDLVAE
ncbi:MAG: cytosine deaminase, partial [Nitrospirota bacterium]|nr:cytosine deaminase [Nitrospirota bacterium]